MGATSRVGPWGPGGAFSVYLRCAAAPTALQPVSNLLLHSVRAERWLRACFQCSCFQERPLMSSIPLIALSTSLPWMWRLQQQVTAIIWGLDPVVAPQA